MTVIMLVLLTLAAFLGGAAFGMWWASGAPPVTPHKDIDALARRDRRRWSGNAEDRWYEQNEQNDGWIQ